MICTCDHEGKDHYLGQGSCLRIEIGADKVSRQACFCQGFVPVEENK